MFLGHPPFHDVHPMKALFLIPKSDPPHLETHPTASKPLKEIVAMCCQKDYTKRPSVKQLLATKFVRNAKKTQVLADLLAERQLRSSHHGQSSKGGHQRNATNSSMYGGVGIDEDGCEEMTVVEEEGDDTEAGLATGDDSWSFTIRGPSNTTTTPAPPPPPPNNATQTTVVDHTPSTTHGNNINTNDNTPIATPSGTIVSSNNTQPHGPPSPSASSRSNNHLIYGVGDMGTVKAKPVVPAGLPTHPALSHASPLYTGGVVSGGASSGMSALTNTLPSRYASNTVRGPGGPHDDDDVSSGSSSDEDGDGDADEQDGGMDQGTVRMNPRASQNHRAPPGGEQLQNMFHRPSVTDQQKQLASKEAPVAAQPPPRATAVAAPPPPPQPRPPVESIAPLTVASSPTATPPMNPSNNHANPTPFALRPSPTSSPSTSRGASPARVQPASVIPPPLPPAMPAASPAPSSPHSTLPDGISRICGEFARTHPSIADALARLQRELETIEAAERGLATRLIHALTKEVQTDQTLTTTNNTNSNPPAASSAPSPVVAPPVPPFSVVRRESKPTISAFYAAPNAATNAATNTVAPPATPFGPRISTKSTAIPSPSKPGVTPLTPTHTSSGVTKPPSPSPAPAPITPTASGTRIASATGFSNVKNLWQQKDEAAKQQAGATKIATPHARQTSK